MAMFGSVPLRTYLPDGDIDLCLVGSSELLLNDSWAEKLRALFDSRGQSGSTDVAVTEVQIIHAEVRSGGPASGVWGPGLDFNPSWRRPCAAGAPADASRPSLMQVKVVKCMVGGVVVDISANQLGGLATVGFLEEVRRGRWVPRRPPPACVPMLPSDPRARRGGEVEFRPHRRSPPVETGGFLPKSGPGAPSPGLPDGGGLPLKIWAPRRWTGSSGVDTYSNEA